MKFSPRRGPRAHAVMSRRAGICLGLLLSALMTTLPPPSLAVQAVAAQALPVTITGSTSWAVASSLPPAGAAETFTYGTRPLVPLIGDWDGDGDRTPGTFEAGTLKLSNQIPPSAATIEVAFGDPRGFPVVGDFNGDSFDDIAIYRNGLWQFRIESGGIGSGGDISSPVATFGTGSWPSTIPVAGDWDGDGVDGVGLYTYVTGQWLLRQTRDATENLAAFTYKPGLSPYPVVGDWNADGIDTVGVKAGTSWLLNDQNDDSASDTTFTFGALGDLPLVGAGTGDIAPIAVDDTAATAEDSAAVAIDVLTNDSDPDGGPKSISSVEQPANGTVEITGGGSGLTYQPDPNYCNSSPGATLDTFTYTLNGGSTASVSMTVTCVDFDAGSVTVAVGSVAELAMPDAVSPTNELVVAPQNSAGLTLIDGPAVAADNDAALGLRDVTLTGVGCVNGRCDQQIRLHVAITVRALAAPQAALESFTLPSPARMDAALSLGEDGGELMDELLIVVGAPGAPGTREQADAAAGSVGAVVSGGMTEYGVYELRWTTPQDLAARRAELADQPGVTAVMPSRFGLLGSLTDGGAEYDGRDAAQDWWLKNIRAPEAWQATMASAGTVGIIDEGTVDSGHDDLDVTRFVGSKAPADHATHVAGLACAKPDGDGTTGVGRGCPVVSAATGVQRWQGVDKRVLDVADDLLDLRALGTNLTTINISLGYLTFTAGKRSCATADQFLERVRWAADGAPMFRQLFGGEAKNVVWTVAAGNSCAPGVFSAFGARASEYDNVIGVAATNEDGALARFSNFSRPVADVEVAAPGGVDGGGAGILSPTWPGNTYERASGTSMAAPIVAGLAALVKAAHPTYEAADVGRCITNSAGTQTGTAHARSSSPDFPGTPISDYTADALSIVDAEAAVLCALPNPNPGPDVPRCNGAPITITGTAGNDVLNGTPGNDVILGGGGHDVIRGNDGDDTICPGLDDDGAGTDGDDTVSGGAGSDTVMASDGADRISGGGGGDELSGGDGDDTISGGEGDDYVQGGDGADAIDGGDGEDYLSGENGADTLDDGDANGDSPGGDYLEGGDDNDVLTAHGGYRAAAIMRTDYLDGGPGDDLLQGSDDPDYLDAGDGHDTLVGGGGYWRQDFRREMDYLQAGAGDDVLTGGRDPDYLDGGDGNDRLSSMGGWEPFLEDLDYYEGGAGDDVLQGSPRVEYLDGGPGADLLQGDGGTQSEGRLRGDFLDAGDGPDTLRGGDGPETLDGGSGADVFESFAGDDHLLAVDLERDATFDCGAGTDVLEADAAEDAEVERTGCE